MVRLMKTVKESFGSMLILLLISCSNSANEPEPSNNNLELTGISSEVKAEGGKMTLQVKSNSEWEITHNCDWLTITPNSGDACQENPISVELNYEFNFYDQRDAMVTLSGKNSNDKKEYKITQPKYTRAQTKYQVGDPEVTFDVTQYDESYKYYDLMLTWKNAGKEGGIPHIEDQLKNNIKTFTPNSKTDDIIKYFEDNENNPVTVLLKSGEYYFDKTLRIYNNQTLIGENVDKVIINVPKEVGADVGSIVSMYNAKNAGIRNLTIIGRWLNEDGENYPKYNDNAHEELPGMGGFRTINISGDNCENCFVDNVKLINNASHPIWLFGNNHTIRNVEIDGAFCKDGGCQGYFFIGGENNLITNCRVTNIRHISFQGEECTKNVFYDNDLRQEVSFHVGDGGDNLIENNRIYIPPTMIDAYNAIMGPWSVQHYVGGLNFIYNNKCKEDNPGRNGATPWSDDQLYLGPYEVSVGTNNPTRYTNFRPVPSEDIPNGKTLYPIILE